MIGYKLQTVLERQLGADFRSKRFLLALSGGPDSMALLHLSARILPANRLYVAHFHHGTRATAERDLLFARRAAHQLNLPFIVGRRSKGRPASEAALRDDRVAFLEAQCRLIGCDFILTGHHARDQLETVLMRLLRGSGLSGLGGIPPVRGRWCRPLLETTPGELLEFLKAETIPFVLDESNASDRYLRNRVRHRVVSELEQLSQEFGGEEAFYRRLTGTLEEVRRAGWEGSQREKSLFRALVTPTRYWCRCTETSWTTLAVTERAGLLRAVVAYLGIEALSRDRLGTALHEIEQRKPAFSVEGGLSVTLSAGFLYFQSDRQRQCPPPVFVREANRIRSEALGMEVEIVGAGGWEGRTLLPGDRIGSQKLKKQLHALGVPRPERRLWPLICERASAQVLWHPGARHPRVRVTRLGFPFAVLSGTAH